MSIPRVMRFSLWCLLPAIILAQGICRAEVTKLPAEIRHVLQDVSHFHEIRSTTNLPPQIATIVGPMANPGEDWQETDVVVNNKLLSRRLIWAAINGDYYVLHYEHGGYAHSHHVLIATFKRGDKRAKIVWHGVTDDSFQDYKAFKAALDKNALHDELDYYY